MAPNEIIENKSKDAQPSGQAHSKPCHICGEHHSGVCKFCPRCRIFHNASVVGCKSKKTAKSVVSTSVLPQKRDASALESSERLEAPQGKRVNFVSETEQMAAAAWYGSEQDERFAEAEGEQQEEYVRSHMLEGEQEHVTDEVEEGGLEEEEDDAWRQRIDLRVVECCDHGVQLSTPPFPFYQYWDAQYDTRKKRRNRRSSRVQRRASPDYAVGGHA